MPLKSLWIFFFFSNQQVKQIGPKHSYLNDCGGNVMKMLSWKRKQAPAKIIRQPFVCKEGTRCSQCNREKFTWKHWYTHLSPSWSRGSSKRKTFRLLKHRSRANLPPQRAAMKQECVLLCSKDNNAFATSGSSKVKAISPAYVSVQTKNFQWPFLHFKKLVGKKKKRKNNNNWEKHE